MNIIYLRKSRADSPDETVEEVLAKHERILQEYCEHTLGYRISEENIYREVVSGESVEDRVEIKKVLSRVEDGNVDAVIVIEPQRLSRGDLIDCGRIIDTFRYSNTRILTPTQSYDLSNKMERRFFQDELMRGHDYLDYVKEILHRGKMESINRGCYLMARAPYGYDKVTIGRDHTLAPNDKADVVRLIFTRYAEGKTSYEIVNELDSLGIKSPLGYDRWAAPTIERMIRNEHYIGKVVYAKNATTTVMRKGQKVKMRKMQSDYIVRDGKHQAIIDEDLFRRANEQTHRPVKQDCELKNIFAGFIFCATCGRKMSYKENSPTRRYLTCKTVGCQKSVRYDTIVDAVINTLEKEELPNLTAKISGDDSTETKMREQSLRKLKSELSELRKQEETQYELLESRVYTQEVFMHRNKILRDKIKSVESNIDRLSQIKSVDYEERTVTLRESIALMKEECISVKAKNAFLTEVIERIEVGCREVKQENNMKGEEISISMSLTI